MKSSSVWQEQKQGFEVVYWGVAATAGADAGYQRFAQAWVAAVASAPACAAQPVRYLSSEVTPGLPLPSSPAGRVMVATNGDMARAVKKAYAQLPLVYASYVPPRMLGPAVNGLDGATGVDLSDELDDYRLHVLRLAFPSAHKIATLSDRDWPDAHTLSPELNMVWADSVEEFTALLKKGQLQGYDAYYVPPTYLAEIAQKEIIEFLRQQKKPAIFSTLEDVYQGGLMAYAQDTRFAYGALAALALRVCQGEAPNTIPMERPRRFELLLRADVDLGGLRIRPDALALVDRVWR